MGGVDDELHVHTSPRPRPTVTATRLEREARTSLARHASTRNASRGQTSALTSHGAGHWTVNAVRNPASPGPQSHSSFIYFIYGGYSAYIRSGLCPWHARWLWLPLTSARPSDQSTTIEHIFNDDTHCSKSRVTTNLNCSMMISDDPAGASDSESRPAPHAPIIPIPIPIPVPSRAHDTDAAV